jgi:hypothetical protein
METAILVSIIAAFAGLLGHFVKQHVDRRQDILREQHARKIPIYTELLEAIHLALGATRRQEPVTLRPELTAKFVTWGSADVVVAYATLRMHLIGNEREEGAVEQSLATLLSQIRKDIGHNDKDAGKRFDELTAKMFFYDLDAAARKT